MSDKKSFDTFIFDLDGTILDTLPDLVVVTNEALREQGFPERTHDEVLSFVGNGLVALMCQAVPENTPKDIADQAVACWKRFNLEYDNHLTAPYPHVPETLAELRRRGCKLGVLSNKFDGGVRKIIAQCLPGLFDVEHGECEEIPRKPNPAGLLRTIEELGSTPERTAYLGDSPNDILVAHRAGACGIGVSWGYHTAQEMRDAGSDIMLESFSDLLKYAPEA